MKHFLAFILILISLNIHAQNICVSVDCKDTVRYPLDTTRLTGVVTSTDGITSTTWQVATGNAKVDSPNNQITTARNLSKGGSIFVFILTGISAKGAVGTAFDTIIYVGNKPPVAVVGPSILSTDGTAVLSGSNSYDPEGFPLTFAWTQLSGPTTAAIANPTMSNPIVSGMINGTYVFALKVTDQGGLTGAASQLVQVNKPITIIKTVTTVVTYYSDGTTTTVVSTVP